MEKHQPDPITRAPSQLVYACPICRFAFALENSKCESVVCPGCNFLLRIEDIERAKAIQAAEKQGMIASAVNKWDVAEDVSFIETTGMRVVALGTLLLSFLLLAVFTYWVLSGDNLKFILTDAKSEELEELAVNEEEVFVQSSEKVVNDYLSAKTPEGIWPLIDQSSVTREQFDDYYNTNSYKAIRSRILGFPQFVKEKGIGISDVTQRGVANRVYTTMQNGSVVVDWQSTEGVNWNLDLLDLGLGDQSTQFRVQCRKGNFYDLIYTEEEWVCVEFTFVGSLDKYYGYFKRDNEELVDKLSTSVSYSSGQITLEVSDLPKDENQNRFLIEDILSINWYYQNH